MASKQIADIKRRKQRGAKVAKAQAKFDKKFENASRKGTGVIINFSGRGKGPRFTTIAPDAGFGVVEKDATAAERIEIMRRLFDTSTQDQYAKTAVMLLPDTVRGTYTDPDGKVRDLRDLPSFIDMLSE